MSWTVRCVICAIHMNSIVPTSTTALRWPRVKARDLKSKPFWICAAGLWPSRMSAVPYFSFRNVLEIYVLETRGKLLHALNNDLAQYHLEGPLKSVSFMWEPRYKECFLPHV